MNCLFRMAYSPIVVTGILFFLWTATTVAQEELPKRAVWKDWQRDISQFHAELQKVVREAQVPEEEAFKKRLDEKSGGLEVVTDGYGGVVDFDAAEGTVQSVVNERFGGMLFEWEFELATDTKLNWDKSTKLIPKIAGVTNGEGKSEYPLLMIAIEKSNTGPFQAGDQVRLKAAIDDFSRFKKGFFRATGLVAIYYLEEGPNPAFLLKLDEAEVTLIQGANQEADKKEPAKPDATPKKTAEENGKNELDQLLEDADERQLIYGPDKKLLAHLDGHIATVWSVEEKRELHRLVLEGRSLPVTAFSPDGGSLVTADVEGNLEYLSTIKLWNLATGEGRLIAKILGAPTQFSFSPDGNRLAAASNLNFIGSITRNPRGKVDSDRIQTGGSIHVWQVSNGDELLKVDIELPEYTAKRNQLMLSLVDESDREKATEALVTAYDEAVRQRVPYLLNFSPDGQQLIGVSTSGHETIIDSKTGKPLRPKPPGEQNGDLDRR